MNHRAVFDTNTVVSALLFSSGRLAWLRNHWRGRACTSLISRVTVAELIRVLAYPRFRLDEDDRVELLSDYLPFCETVEEPKPCPQRCRDANDQPFLDLAFGGKADVLVSGDKDILALAGETGFAIRTPESYRAWLSGH